MYKAEDVVEYLRKNKAKGINQIAEEMSWSPKFKDKNREFMEKLEEEGKVIKVKGDKYSVPEKYGYILGKLEVIENRFGFVDVAGEESIFVPRSGFKGAVSGDLVFVNVFKESDSSRKKEGEVVKVVKRDKDIVGGGCVIVTGKDRKSVV